MNKRLHALALVGVTLASGAAWGKAPPAGTIAPATLKLPDGPGSVQGLSDKAQVNVFSAQVSYSVPVDLPASSAGFRPQLSLSYSGDLGNGPLGVGWTLTSAEVRRSLRHGVPSYTDSDELELIGVGGGGRLVSIGGTSYRIEGQGNSLKVEREHNRFVVTDASGTRYVLGLSEESRLGDGGRTAAWYVERVVDLAGQSVRYRYLREGGQLYVAEILWGPGEVFRATLVYEWRKDAVRSYRTGFRVDTQSRLREILVTSFGQRLRSYRLTYDESLSLSRLAKIELLGRTDALALPPLTFRYAAETPAALVPLTGTDGWVLGQRGVTFLDVDGDGMGDLARLELGNHEVRKNLGGHFASAAPLSGASAVELEASRLLDLDGDARPELVRVVNDTWRAYRLDGPRWTGTGEVAGTRNVGVHDAATVFSDLNGDGRTDVIRGAASGLFVQLGRRSALEPAAFVRRISAGDPEVEPGLANVRFQDVNGDGLADVVWFLEDSLKIFHGLGDGTFVVAERVFYPWNRGVADVEDLQLADLNRDGLVDLVRFTAGHVLFYRGDANGRFQPTPRFVARPEETSSDVVVTLADANGNGSEDLVWSSPRGMWALDLAGATSAGMLVGIDNGLGKTTALRYSASALLSASADATSEPWVHKLPVSVPVPVQVTIDAGDGSPPRVTDLGVRDGFWDGEERRFGGFLQGRKVIAGASAAEGRREDTRFLPGLGEERVLRGLPWYVRLENGLGQVHTIVTTEIEARRLPGLGSDPRLYKAVTTSTRTYLYEGVAKPIETLTTFESFDPEGRPQLERRAGRVDVSGDESVLVRQYGDDATTWVRDRVCDEKLLDGQGALVGHTQTFYGGPADPRNGLCVIGKGLVREVWGYLATEARWVEAKRIRYDELFNPIEVREGGVTRTLAYDANLLRPIRETVAPTAGATLSWSMTWDDVLGQPTALTDPNGVVTQVSYDELGRLKNVAVNGALPHLHYVYDWTAPRPRTTTYAFDGTPGELTAFGGTWTPGGKWRESVAVANGAGEDLYSATRLETGRWIVGGWKERDAKGRVVFAGDAVYWANALLPASRPVDMVGQTLKYDALDRLVLQTLPNGAKKSVAYAALQQTVTSDGLAPVTSFLDGLERVTRTERTVNGITESVDATYDAAGRILQMSLQGGRAVHSFAYDSLGRLVSAYDPDIGARSMSYFDEGWLKTHTNGTGQTVVYGYDGIGRITRGELHRWNGVAVDPAIEELFEYHYDVAKDGLPGCRTQGRLAWVAEPAGSAQFCYDALGRQEKVTRRVDGMSAWQKVAYSLSGLPLQTSFDDGFSTTAAYDAAGRPLSVRDGGGELWRADAQDASARVLTETYGNQATQAYQRDVLGLAQKITIQRPVTRASYYDVDIQRNSYGAITTVADRDGLGLSHDADFGYDGAGRLTRALLDGTKAKPYEFTYQYDGLQNMLARTATGPRELGVLTGAYRYGEASRGPRQLTSILSDTPRSDAPLSIYTLTANAGTSSGDGGPSKQAHLSSGGSVAVLGDGSVVLSDACRVRKIDTAGIIRTIVGTGVCGAVIPGRRGTETPISSRAVSVGTDGKTVFISTYAQVVKLDAAGYVSVVAGTGTVGTGGDGGDARLAELYDVAMTAQAKDGTLYIAEYEGRRIRVVSPQGLIRTLAVPAWVSGLGPAGGIALDADGKGLLVAFIWGWKVVYVPLDGVTGPTVFAGTGAQGSSGDGGAATSAKLDGPGQVAVAADGTVYITEYFGHRVRRVVRSTGKISTVVGTGVAGSNGADGSPAALAQINTPNGLAVGANGTVLVAEWVGYIRRLTPEPLLRFDYDAAGRQVRQGNLELVYNGLDELLQVRETAPGFSGNASVTAPLVGHKLAHRGGSSTGDGGPAADAGIYGARGLVTLADGSVVIAGDCRLRKINAARIITTIAGNGTCAPSVSGVLATEQPVTALSVSLGKDGRSLLLVGSHQILRMDEAGMITVVAGTGTRGFGGNEGDARLAELDLPGAAVEGLDGSVYLSETGNLNGYHIRVVTPDGVMHELPMPAAGASLGPPGSLALARDGKALFVSYAWAYRVVRLELNGLAMPSATIWAGTGAAASTGDGDLATRASLDLPGGIALGPDGSLYIAEISGRRIRQVLPGNGHGPGWITTVVGNGGYANPASGPEGGRGTDYTLNAPGAIAVDARGSVYLADESVFQFERNSLVAEHTYGYDGLRTSTQGRDGRKQYWFTPDVRQWEENGIVKREHYVRLGDRTIARVTKVGTRADTTVAGAIDWTPPVSVDPEVVRTVVQWLVLGMGLLLLALGITRRRRPRWQGASAALALVAFTSGACGMFLPTGETQGDVWSAGGTLYFHPGIAAGPVLMTREDGTVFEERRYEPFGQPIDAYKEPIGATPAVGIINFENEPLNTLNKETDPNTGWSYHGARWMAPEHARWLTPDPPVKAPDGKFMGEPWDLNPYQYGRQNPVVYWDPDGRCVEGSRCEEALIALANGPPERSLPVLLAGLGAAVVGGAIALAATFGAAVTFAAAPKVATAVVIAETGIDIANVAVATTAVVSNPTAENTLGLAAATVDLLSGPNPLGDINTGRVAAKGPIWSPTKSKTPVQNAFGHWKKHGAEFPEFRNAKEYVEGAQGFVNQPPQGVLSKVRSNGDTVLYDPASNTFGVRAADGAPRTMFRPDPAQHGYPTNLDYFNAQ